MGKHHEQLLFLCERPPFAFIQWLVAALACEEVIKGGLQSSSLGGTWVLSVVQEALIQLPEGLAKILQEVAMKSHSWNQFLGVTEFMDPAQCQLCRQPVELGSIITE